MTVYTSKDCPASSPFPGPPSSFQCSSWFLVLGMCRTYDWVISTRDYQCPVSTMSFPFRAGLCFHRYLGYQPICLVGLKPVFKFCCVPPGLAPALGTIQLASKVQALCGASTVTPPHWIAPTPASSVPAGPGNCLSCTFPVSFCITSCSPILHSEKMVVLYPWFPTQFLAEKLNLWSQQYRRVLCRMLVSHQWSGIWLQGRTTHWLSHFFFF